MDARRKRIWGWYAFDWASQPFHTLILTFIFAPYFVLVLGDPVAAQAVWGQTLAITGLVTAVLAPIVGALADRSGRLVTWVAGLSAVYVAACASLWLAVPGMPLLWPILVAFGAGLLAAELSIIVTNAFLPSLGGRAEIGRISGNGYAIGYAGGLISLLLTLAFFAQNADGRTFLGLAPAFGLDASRYEGTRFVGPLCALWFAASMVLFFAWIKDPVRPAPPLSLGGAVRGARNDLRAMLARTAGRPSLVTFLVSSMFYRDALNGLYAFGGIYATGVLGWSIVEVGVFGVVGVASAGLASWAGGHFDSRLGPKPVIVLCIAVLLAVCLLVVGMGRESLYGMPLGAESRVPDRLMYLAGPLIGGAGGALQASSRSLMVRQAAATHPTEAFGLYAMTGKATAFLAPLAIAAATSATGDQRWGVSPLIVLFMAGLLLLPWVKKDGDA